MRCGARAGRWCQGSLACNYVVALLCSMLPCSSKRACIGTQVSRQHGLIAQSKGSHKAIICRGRLRAPGARRSCNTSLKPATPHAHQVWVWVVVDFKCGAQCGPEPVDMIQQLVRHICVLVWAPPSCLGGSNTLETQGDQWGIT